MKGSISDGGHVCKDDSSKKPHWPMCIQKWESSKRERERERERENKPRERDRKREKKPFGH